MCKIQRKDHSELNYHNSFHCCLFSGDLDNAANNDRLNKRQGLCGPEVGTEKETNYIFFNLCMQLGRIKMNYATSNSAVIPVEAAKWWPGHPET